MRGFQSVVAAIATPFIVVFYLTAAAASPVFIGEEFNFVATQLSPPGAGTGIGTITIGTPTSGDFYTVSDGSFISAMKGCLTCKLLTQDLSDLIFDSATLGIKGTATGTFLGDIGGDLHNFILIVTDAPALTWDFTKHNLVTDITKKSSGTYYLAETPLPSTWLMLLSGFFGLGFLAYRGTKKRTADVAAA
jgi:hypothetical protein